MGPGERAEGGTQVGAGIGSVPDLERRVAALRGVALFSGFAPSELAELAVRCAERSYAKGDVLWRAGDPGSELLVVVSGELAVWGAGDGGDDLVVAWLRPGDFLGEIALLLGEERSATVTCARAARVLVLDRAQFADLREDPRVLGEISTRLGHRLARLTRTRRAVRSTIVVGVTAREGARGATMIAAALAPMLARWSGRPVVHLRLVPGAPELHHAWRSVRGTPETVRRLEVAPSVLDGDDSALDGLVAEATPPVLVVDVPSTPSRGISAVVDACDVVVEVVTDPEVPAVPHAPHTRILRVVNRYGAAAPPMPVDRCEPFVLPVEPALEGRSAAEQAELLAEDPPRPAARTLGRLARKILGCTVGLALGGGAAFGIAHVGVLLALEEAGVPVDLVAGTSMGSIVALAYASGVPAGEMLELAHRIGNVRTTLSVLDPSLSGAGLLAGRRLVSLFEPVLGDGTTFDALVLPARAVATDIESGERVAIGEGRLDDAFRASSAVPLVFTPARRDGRTLVDGAMVDPVPAEVVREMGADLVVAVNVVPHLRRGVSTAISRTYKRLNRLNPLARLGGSRDLPDLVDIVMNSFQALQHELGTFKARSADVLVQVDLATFTWIEFYRAAEIVERGLEAGRRAVPEIREVLAARTGGAAA